MVHTVRTGGAIVSMLLAIASQTLLIANVGTIFGYTIDFGWVTLGGITVFASLMWWRIYELSSTLPSIEVNVIDDFGFYYLEVFNKGKMGRFKVQLEILDSLDFIEPRGKLVAGHWIIGGGRESDIMHGQRDRIRIATLENPPNVSTVRYELYCDIGGGEGRWRHSSFWNPFSEHEGAGAWFCIKVTISSNPELKSGVFVKTYKLDNNGLGVFDMSKPKENKQKKLGITRDCFHRLLAKASQPIKKSEKEKS